jgi:glycosyltransferase involved in cell wall biosynthesis
MTSEVIPMKILFVTPSYKPAYIYGGPAISVSELAEALTGLGHPVTVYTTAANGKEELNVPLGKPVMVNGVTVYYFKRITGDHTHISPALWKKLWATCKEFDTVHLHSWWSILITGAAWICARQNIDFIVSPRGMLGQYSFAHQHGILKRIMHRLIGKRLMGHSFLHATTLLEWKDCRQVYPGWEGFILPNLINLPAPGVFEKRNENKVFTLGFLSRLDPKKGIELVFQALSQIPFDFRFLIAGSGDERYVGTLRSLASRLGISEKIEWCGWKNGDEKFHFFESIDLFILTSYNENFAIAVTESLSVGTAVLVSEWVGLADYVREKKLGWVCVNDIGSIRKNLTVAYQSREERERIKGTAPATISHDFNKKNLALQYVSAYQLVGRVEDQLALTTG